MQCNQEWKAETGSDVADEQVFDVFHSLSDPISIVNVLDLNLELTMGAYMP